MNRSLRLLAVPAVAALALAGCSSGEATPGGSGRLRITASFYPLQYVAERIGGTDVQVSSLTKPGAEPHDLELTPQDVAGLTKADVVVYLKGFQPAVDDAISTTSPKVVFDASTTARLDLTYTPIEEGEAKTDAAGSPDPHFWLDPTRLDAVATALAAVMEKADPDHGAAFRANAAALSSDLTALDKTFATGLSNCANKDLVTSHNAFGYLAQRYGLKQVGITGLTPEAEPVGKQLAAVTDFVRENKVQTIYYETLVSPAVARTVATATGVKTAVLDPIEGLNDTSQGTNYLEVMQADLDNLRQGQPCR